MEPTQEALNLAEDNPIVAEMIDELCARRVEAFITKLRKKAPDRVRILMNSIITSALEDNG